MTAEHVRWLISVSNRIAQKDIRQRSQRGIASQINGDQRGKWLNHALCMMRRLASFIATAALACAALVADKVVNAAPVATKEEGLAKA